MGGGMEADLTHGAVASIGGGSGGRDGGGPDPRRCGGDVAAGGRLRPVLQVVGAPTARGHGVVRYPRPALRRRALQQAMLPTSLNGLVTTGRLRDGSVVRVLESVYCRRVIIVIQLEILQTECTLIGSPKIYQVNAAQPNIRSYSGSLSIHGSRLSKIEEEALGRSDKPDWITVEGTISHISTERFSYPSCTRELDEAGEEILGLTAQELFMIKNVCQDAAQFAEIIQRACSQLYLFKLKIKEEVYGDEARVKVSIAKAERLGVTLKKSSVPRASHILSDDGLGPRRVVSVRNCPAVMDMQGLHR
ncbi:hypothetical protein ACQ4PT_058666 [Festuca glaucescens]